MYNTVIYWLNQCTDAQRLLLLWLINKIFPCQTNVLKYKIIVKYLYAQVFEIII